MDAIIFLKCNWISMEAKRKKPFPDVLGEEHEGKESSSHTKNKTQELKLQCPSQGSQEAVGLQWNVSPKMIPKCSAQRSVGRMPSSETTHVARTSQSFSGWYQVHQK